MAPPPAPPAPAAGRHANGTAPPPDGPVSYNELATLTLVTGEDVVKRLLARGTHRELGYAAVATMLALYAGGAVWAAGSAISSGLFVPMLVIGSCVGRLVGLAAVDAAAARGAGSAGAPPGVFLPPSPWAWVDPGAFALIGAASFMGGVTRLTLSLAVIMMEVSNDVRMLLPLLVGVLTAKWVADAASHSLYHGLLEAKCVPWLPPTPVSGVPLDLVPVSAAAAAPVAVAREVMPASELRALLRDTTHHGFPVVRDSQAGSVYVGVVARDTLMALLRRGAMVAARQGGGAAADIPYDELSRVFVTAAARSLLSEQQLAVLGGQGAGLGGGAGGGGPGRPHASPAPPTPGGSHPDGAGPLIDLSPYVDTSAPAVPEAFSLGRAYTLFVTLGLRHLPVVDAANRVKAIVTRKDLLGFRLDDAADRALGGEGGTSPARRGGGTWGSGVSLAMMEPHMSGF